MIALAFNSLFAPRETIRRILRLPYDRNVFLLAAGLLACVSGIVNGLFVPTLDGSATAPIAVAIRQMVLFAVLAFAIDRLGRMFGGKGTFDGALRVVVWHSAVEVIAMVIMFVSVVIFGALGQLALVVMLFWLFYILAVFVQELHGFKSLFLTIVGLIAGGIAIGIPAMLILAALGLVNLEAMT